MHTRYSLGMRKNTLFICFPHTSTKEMTFFLFLSNLSVTVTKWRLNKWPHLYKFLVVLMSQDCSSDSIYHSYIPGNNTAWVSPVSTQPPDTQIRNPIQHLSTTYCGLYLVTPICKEGYEMKFFARHEIRFLLLREKGRKEIG